VAAIALPLHSGTARPEEFHVIVVNPPTPAAVPALRVAKVSLGVPLAQPAEDSPPSEVIDVRERSLARVEAEAHCPSTQH
jgi:hypothetical protein